MSQTTGLLIAAAVITLLLHLVTYRPLMSHLPGVVGGIHGVPKRLILVVLALLAAFGVLWMTGGGLAHYSTAGIVTLILYAVADFFESIIEAIRRQFRVRVR